MERECCPEIAVMDKVESLEISFLPQELRRHPWQVSVVVFQRSGFRATTGTFGV